MSPLLTQNDVSTDIVSKDVSYDLLFQQRREEYLALKQTLFSAYMQRKQEPQERDLFFCFNSSDEHRYTSSDCCSAKELQRLLTGSHTANVHNGGYFFRWQHMGICLNPSDGFLQRFCESGHHLWEIDAIIVTSADPKASYEVEHIHRLNRELNTTLIAYEQPPHVIHSLLHPVVAMRLATHLRPIFREEKSSVISLEAFQDEERHPLGEHCTLWYANAGSDTLMIRLEGGSQSFGYLSGTEWNDKCRHFFKKCNLFLAGIKIASLEEFEGLATPDSHSIGLQGLCRIAQELEELDCLLVSEFDAASGDIRLEVIKKLHVPHKVILPIDAGFVMDLQSQAIKTGPGHFIPCKEVRIVRPQLPFSQLLFVSKDDIL